VFCRDFSFSIPGFSGTIPFVPKNFRHFGFFSKKIWPYKLSSGIFLDFPDFKPEKIRPENFQSKNFSGF